MNSKSNVSNLLDTVEKSLATSNFRNAYEANNTCQSNVERLDAAETALKHLQLSGAEIDEIQRRILALRSLNEERTQFHPTGGGSAISNVDWLKQLEAEATCVDDDEVITTSKKPKKDKKDKKEKKEKESKQLQTPPPAPEPRKQHQESAEVAKKAPVKVLHAMPNCGFMGIPPEALTGKCTVTQIPNSPCVELCYEKAVHAPSGELATCVVVAYRVVVAALWKGIPIHSASKLEKEKFDKRSDKGQGHFAVTAEDTPQEDAAPLQDPHSDASDEEMVIHDTDENEATDLNPVDDTVREFSERLVQEYKEAEADDDAEYFARGRDAPSQIIIPTPHLRNTFEAPWAVLMCHGGYFVGGVFVNGKAIVHRAFQRYVVRKKQGGMQSKADKTGGVMKSAGSQIRRHNELKWKVMVRDTLLQWKEHIDACWIILYVAPGPDNRAVLTDFSNIPASFGVGSTKGAARSPVDVKDIRVRSAPLTTHKPTFAEVQRIYHEVSRVTVRLEEYSE